MPRPGGESGKFGDNYEAIWTVDQLIELSLGRATQICIEEVGAEADGVEFRLVGDDGVNSFHSAKRQRSRGEWSLAELTKPSATGRSILGDLIKKLREDSSATCVLVSGTGANDLREACEAARRCDSADDFERLIRGMSALRRELDNRLVKGTRLAEWPEVHGLLRRIRVVLKDPATLQADVEERLRAHFARSDLRPIDASDERRALGELVLNKLGVPLTSADILRFLESRNVVRRDSLAQPDVRSAIEQSVEHYLRVVNGDLVNSNSIPRAEADQAVQHLVESSDSTGALIVGSAGFGKSCVLAQIIGSLRPDVPIMVVRLDELDAVRSTTDLGIALGLSVSPITALAGMAGHRSCVFVVDQLDAVSELSGRKSSLWDVFERLRTEAARFIKMKLLVACRSFDLEHDHRLRRLTAKDSGFTQITLEPLPLPTVEAALSAAKIDAAAVSNTEKELLRVPLHLHLFLISYERGQTPIATRQDLFDRFWATKEVRVRNRCDGECYWQEVIDALVKNMSTRAALTAVDDVVAPWMKTVDAMASEHVLVRDGRRLRFFHESFVDYAFARGFAARGESLVDFLLKTDQGLFYRSLVRQVLTHLRDDDRASYLRTLHEMMKDARIRFHLKVLALDWLSSLTSPTEDEWRLVESLTRVIEIGDRAFWVIRNSIGWFDLLDSLGVVAGWMSSRSEQWRNSALWLLRSPQVREHRSASLARLLRGWRNESERRGDLASAVLEQDVWRSDEMQALFLELLPEIISLPTQPSRHHEWWDAIHETVKHNPGFVLQCVTLWIDNLIAKWSPDTQDDRVFERNEVNQRAAMVVLDLAKSLPLDFARTLLPRIMRIIGLTAHECNDGLITDRTWHFRAASDFHGADCGLLESAILAFELLAKDSPVELDKLLDPLASSPYETAIYMVLRSWMSQPKRYAPRLHSLFCTKPESLGIGYSAWSKGNPTHAVSREAIGKCLPYWTDEEIAELEQAILGFVPWVTATQDQIDWHRHLLLSAIDASHLSEIGRRAWAELHARFPDEELRLPTRGGSGITGSPIPSEVTANFTDDEWLDAMHKHNTDWSGPRRHFEGTAVELSRVLERQVEVEPGRFASLTERMDDSIHPLYFSAILSGICPLNSLPNDAVVKRVPAETVMAVIRRLHALPSRPCGTGISHAFSRLDECELGPELLDILEYYATQDPDPSEDKWQTTTHDGKNYWGGDAHMAGYNSVRGSAARSIGALLYDRRGLLGRFLPVLERLVSDPVLSVRTCAIEALLPLLNFNKDKAVRLFLRACDGAESILGADPVERFYYWATVTHYDVLRPILLKALDSTEKDATDTAARQICLASFSVAMAESDAETVVGGTETMRKAAASVFASNLKVPSCRERCLTIMPSLFADESAEVRDMAARCWHDFTRNDLIRDESLIESYVESKAFPSKHDLLVHQLEETHAPLPRIMVKMAKRFLSAITSCPGNRPHPAVYESSEIATLIVRLYSQTHDAELRKQCLDLIDEMAKLRIDVDRHLADHDR